MRRAWGFGFLVSGFGSRVQLLVCRAWGLGFGVSGFGFRVQGLGLSMRALRFRGSVFGLRAGWRRPDAVPPNSADNSPLNPEAQTGGEEEANPEPWPLSL